MVWTKVYAVEMPLGMILLAFCLIISLVVDFVYQPKVVLVHQILLRGTALTTFCALYSLLLQIRGLIGENGLVPIVSTMRTLDRYLLSLKEEETEEEEKQQEIGTSRTLFMKGIRSIISFLAPKHLFHMALKLVREKLSPSTKDTDITEHLQNTLRLDMMIAFFTILLPYPIFFLYLYFAYYSYKRIFGPFLNFQWDILLLETLFLTFFASFVPYTTVYPVLVYIWIYKLLLFRLMFGSGMVKAYGQDSTWHTSYSAMTYHFLTQPLPTWLGRILHTTLSKEMLIVLTWFTLISEIHFPLLTLLNISFINGLIFLIYIALQLGICTAGNFGFFNYFSMLLGFALLTDDQLWSLLNPLCTYLTPLDAGRFDTTFSSVLQGLQDVLYYHTYVKNQHAFPTSSHNTVSTLLLTFTNLGGKITEFLVGGGLPYDLVLIGWQVILVGILGCGIILLLSSYYVALIKLFHRTKWIVAKRITTPTATATTATSTTTSSSRTRSTTAPTSPITTSILNTMIQQIRIQCNTLFEHCGEVISTCFCKYVYPFPVYQTMITPWLLTFFEEILEPIHEHLGSLAYVGNHYGLFANMTKTRYELILSLGVLPPPPTTTTPRTSMSKIRGGGVSANTVLQGRISPMETLASPSNSPSTTPITPTPCIPNTIPNTTPIVPNTTPITPTIPNTIPNAAPNTAPSTPPSKASRLADIIAWEEIVFAYKPDQISHPMKPVHPFFHLPRLDWMLWFLALRPPQFSAYPTWFLQLLIAILEGNEDVYSLFPASLRQLRDRLLAEYTASLSSSQQKMSQGLNGADTDTDTVFQLPLVMKLDLYEYEYTTAEEVGEEEGEEEEGEIFMTKEEVVVDNNTQDVRTAEKSASSNSSSSSNSSGRWERGKYWKRKHIVQILPPATLYDVYELYDMHCSSSSNSRNSNSSRGNSNTANTAARRGPTPETASDIIMRTLFKHMKQQKHQPQPSEVVAPSVSTIRTDVTMEKEKTS